MRALAISAAYVLTALVLAEMFGGAWYWWLLAAPIALPLFLILTAFLLAPFGSKLTHADGWPHWRKRHEDRSL